MEPTKASEAGEVRVVDSRNFPVSKHIAAALLIIKPGHMRELHWHPNASEWQYYIAGKGRMTVFFPVDNARTMDYSADDVGYVPSNAPHYFENRGDTDLVVLEMFAADQFVDVSLNQWLRRVPSEMLKAHLNIDKEMAMKIPAGSCISFRMAHRKRALGVPGGEAASHLWNGKHQLRAWIVHAALLTPEEVFYV